MSVINHEKIVRDDNTNAEYPTKIHKSSALILNTKDHPPPVKLSVEFEEGLDDIHSPSAAAPRKRKKRNDSVSPFVLFQHSTQPEPHNLFPIDQNGDLD